MDRIKRGTRVLISNPSGAKEYARILPWRESINGKRERVPDYHLVRFEADNARLLVHASYMSAA